MAIGSLVPDSISNVDLTRSLNPNPFDRSNEKTAAESVELIIATNKKQNGQLNPNKKFTNGANNNVVIITPKVERIRAGLAFCL